MRKFLLSLFVVLFWFIGFSSAWTVEYNFWQINFVNQNSYAKYQWFIFSEWLVSKTSDNYNYSVCFDWLPNWYDWNVVFCENSISPSNCAYVWLLNDWCRSSSSLFNSNKLIFIWLAIWYNAYTISAWTVIPNFTMSITSDAFNSNSSNYTSEECQSEYSLMPIDSCNSEYCELNWLCEVIWWSWSSTLYINDVRHESAPFIYVNIPEEFKRDYLTWEQEFTINVEWLNGDQDYINWIIDVNSYRPSSEDFTQTFVWWLTLIFPYIIITAVILFIRRFIRKIFK